MNGSDRPLLKRRLISEIIRLRYETRILHRDGGELHFPARSTDALIFKSSAVDPGSDLQRKFTDRLNHAIYRGIFAGNFNHIARAAAVQSKRQP